MAATSEARVQVDDYQRASPDQLNATNDLLQATMDNIVSKFLYNRPCYGGMSVSANVSNFGVVVGSGTLYTNGVGYALATPYAVDLTAACAGVPTDKLALVAILAAGYQDDNAEVLYASFLDPAKKPARPGVDPWPLVDVSTPTRKVRYVQISSPVGDADVQPEMPSFGSSLCLIATVTISKNGIVADGIFQNEDTRIYSLDALGLDARDLALWRSVAEPLIATLLSSVAALSAQLGQLNLASALANLQAQINDLASRLQAGSAVLRGADYYMDESQSATTATGYNATVREGLRFPSGYVDQRIEPQNRFASNIKVTSNLLLPFYTNTISTKSPAHAPNTRGLIRLDMANYNTVEAPGKRRGFAVLRHRWGRQFLEASTAQVLASGDPNLLFGLLPGDVGYDVAVWGDWRTGSTELTRRHGFWSDLAARGPWSRVLAQIILSGVPGIAQPFRTSGGQMITGVRVPLERGSGAGSVRVLVTGNAGGNPDLSQIYGDVTVNQADFGTDVTVVTFPEPVYKAPGGTIHFVLLVSGPHKLRAVPMNSDLVGALGGRPRAFVGGTWSVIETVREVGLGIVTADFGEAGIARVPCEPLTLAGGIDAVDIVAPVIAPPGTSISYELTIGGQQVPIAEVLGAHPLTGSAASLPLTMVMTYTSTVAPMIDISGLATGAKARLSKSGTALKHISATRSPATPIIEAEHIETIEQWDAANATVTARLLHGASFATEVVPTTITDEALPNGGLRRAWRWTALPSVGAHRVSITGTATDPSKTWVGRVAQFFGKA